MRYICLFSLQLLLLPDFSSQSVFYADQVASGDTSLLESCIPHSVALGGVREECMDIVFALSVEFYRQVFGKSTKMCQISDQNDSCDMIFSQSVIAVIQ